MREPLRYTLFCLRFACILCRTRDDSAIPGFRLKVTDHRINVELPAEWQQMHPLTMADLLLEMQQLQPIGLQLAITATGKIHEPA